MIDRYRILTQLLPDTHHTITISFFSIRDGRFSTFISSQLAANYWIETLPDRVGVDSLESRLNNGQQRPIGDFDMRKATAPFEPNE